MPSFLQGFNLQAAFFISSIESQTVDPRLEGTNLKIQNIFHYKKAKIW